MLIFAPWWGALAPHAARITGRRVMRYLAPFMRHRIPQNLRAMGLMSTVASRAIKGGLNPVKFRRLLRKRHHDPGYVRALLELARAKGHGALVRRVMARAALPLSPQARADLAA